MNSCICNRCKNLKSVIDDGDSSQNEIIEECEFGFPSESCLECETSTCELSCENYVANEEESLVTTECIKCGKVLKIAASNVEAGDVYCPVCYLEKMF